MKRTIEDKDIYWEMDWTKSKERLKDEPDHDIHKKPDKQLMFEEEPAIAMLLLNQVIFVNSHWWKKDEGWPEDACKVISMNVNCNDVFYWACADGEEMEYHDIKDVYDHWIKDPSWGTAVWCIKKRNMMPQKPVYDRIQADGIWNLDEMGLQPNDAGM